VGGIHGSRELHLTRGPHFGCLASTGLYLEKMGIGEKVRNSVELNVIRYVVFGIAVFKIREQALLSKLSFCSACNQFDCFLFRSFRSKSQTILRTSQRTDRSSKKMPFWGMRKSLYADYLIHWLFNNAVSNARANT
jgi:hypothetical protein